MNETTQNMPVLDRILDEIEVGRVLDAVLQLAGMMDAALATAQFSSFHAALTTHPLGQVLRSKALSHPLTFAQDDAPAQTSPTEQRLFHAIARLGFARAIRARRSLGAAAIESAWRRGHRIGLLQCGDLGEMHRLSGKDHSNIHRCDRLSDADGPFDLILASSLPDQCDQPALSARLAEAARALRGNGTILLSAFAPEHLGRGWQALFLNAEPHCHDESNLSEAAARSGLSISQFRDASGSLIWAELKRGNIHGD